MVSIKRNVLKLNGGPKEYPKKTDKVTFVDLFSGIGGFHIGIKQASKKSSVDWECLLAVDKDEKAVLTYSNYFKTTKILDDITLPEVKEQVPYGVDIVCGGFPCQPFSQAGKKLGMSDDRGTLFTHIVDILKTREPKVVFLENVKNLENIDNGNTIKTIMDAIDEAGYYVHRRHYKATDFGLPTHRPRLYIVGFKKELFSEPDWDNWWPKPHEEETVTLSSFFENLGKEWDFNINRSGWPDRVGKTLRLGGIGSAFKSVEWLKKQKNQPAFYIKTKDNKIWINDKRNWDSYLLHEGDPKRIEPHTLTVEEAKAIMGFPADFHFPDDDLLSPHQQMRQLGNSVAINTIEAIAAKIIETIYANNIAKTATKQAGKVET